MPHVRVVLFFGHKICWLSLWGFLIGMIISILFLFFLCVYEHEYGGISFFVISGFVKTFMHIGRHVDMWIFVFMLRVLVVLS